ncbi:MAG TPA: hypothetical protein VFQ51_15285 [Vicinamibacteria bacterium]|nr:hypothetical protein [Vicinamibacteria bacterium]
MDLAQRTLSLVAVSSLWIVTAAHAQPAAVWAGANDNPNTLITGIFDGTSMSYLPEVLAGGSSGGPPNGFTESQVRVFAGAPQGRCSLVAQINTQSNTVAVYTIGASGTATHAAGSPFPTGGLGAALAWARDGQALYVARSYTGAASVETFRVACTPGGTATVTDAGPTTFSLITGLRDTDVTPSGGHLCITGNVSGNAGCYAIDPITRLPATSPVNTVAAPDARGLRISGTTGCGVLGLESSNQVRGFLVSGAGLITLTNTAAAPAPPFHGAVSPDGVFAAFGTSCCTRQVALYNVAPGTCTIALAGSTAASDPGGAPYVAFDRANRLYVADVNLNRIRVFQATASGPGSAISTSTTNHATTNPPIGIDAAMFADFPVTLQSLTVE